MADDLTARLRATSRAYEDRESGAQPDDLELARLLRDVRRQRTGRGVRHAAVAAVAVAVVSTAGWFGLRGVPDAIPAHTPTPTPPTTSPTPSPERDRTPVDRAGMPTMWSLDDAVLADVGPGWTLATYGPADSLSSDAPDQVVLASPDGRLFHVPDAAAGPDRSVVSWDGGATAVVATADGRASLDLRTGATTPDPRGLPDGVHPTGRAAGAELWQSTDGAAWVVPDGGEARRVPGPGGIGHLSPDATRGLVTADDGRVLVADLATGATLPVGDPLLRCHALGWADAATVALLCSDPTDADTGGFFPYLLADPASRPRYVLAPAAGAGVPQVREIGPGELVPGQVLPLGGGGVVVAGTPLADDVIACTTTVEVRTGDTVTPLTTPERLPWATVTAAEGDVVHVLRYDGCGAEGGGPSELVVVDTGTGVSTVLPGGPGADRAMVPTGAAVTVTR